MILGVSEFLNVVGKLTFNASNTLTFDSIVVNYDKFNISFYNGPMDLSSESVKDFFYIVKNSLTSLSNYLYTMANRYIIDGVSQANTNTSLVLILTIISIAITILTAFVIMPILHMIERSKEKVLMIYTELKKE